MQLRKGNVIEILITDLAFGGAGVGKLPQAVGITPRQAQDDSKNFVIFVEGCAPGDRVKAKLTKIKKQFAEARLEEILEPSKERISPRCRHFGICGGCTYQFLPYKEQLKWKEKIVRDAIERIGDFENAPILEIHGSPSEWFYRNKMEFTWGEPTVPPSYARSDTCASLTVGHSRPPPLMRSGAGPTRPAPSLIVGLHKRGKFDDVFDLQECYLQSQFSVSVIHWIKKWALENGLAAFDFHKKTGLLKTLIIREARSTGEWLVNLVTSADPFESREKFAQEITTAFPQITSLFHTVMNVQKGHRTTMTETLLAGKPFLTEIVRVEGLFRDGLPTLSLIFDIAPSAFFQTNSRAAEHLFSVLLALGAPRTDDIVLDLYCGTGIMGMFFAKLAAKVYGVELNQNAVESARQNAVKNGLKNIEFFCGDAAEMVAPFGRVNELTELRLGLAAKNIAEKPTIIIVDPPRAGLTNKTIELLLKLSPAKILYVSCNPTTLARDLKVLCGAQSKDQNGNSPAANYLIKKIQPLDMFPQTYHVECVCLLQKKIDVNFYGVIE